MVESRITFVTDLWIGKASAYPQLTLVGGFPDAESLEDYFEKADLIPESGELTEASEDTPQGDLIRYQLRARAGRESDFHTKWKQTRCMAAVELANGERILIGSDEYPLIYGYARTTGVQQTDPSDDTLTWTTAVPMK